MTKMNTQSPIYWRLDYYLGALLRFWGRAGELANLFGSAHRVERARNDLRRAGSTHFIGRFRFEQLGMSQDDAELIVQAVEEEAQVL